MGVISACPAALDAPVDLVAAVDAEQLARGATSRYPFLSGHESPAYLARAPGLFDSVLPALLPCAGTLQRGLSDPVEAAYERGGR